MRHRLLFCAFLVGLMLSAPGPIPAQETQSQIQAGTSPVIPFNNDPVAMPTLGRFSTATSPSQTDPVQAITQVVRHGTYAIFLYFSAACQTWVTLYSLLLAIGFAVGDARPEDVRNLIVGGTIVILAGTFTNTYYALWQP